MSATAQHRLDQENSDERDARLSDMRVRGRQSAIFNDAVFTKMNTFHKKMSNCDFLACSCCNESFPADNPNSSCAHCVRDKHQPKLYSHDNNMDPGILPPELQGLSQIEQVLISAVVPMMSVYKLPHGQYGYSGHVLNLPQNVSSFAKQLPRLPSELDVVLVRKVYESGSHKDFRVRRSNVLHALQWLKANNKYYRSISIDDQALQQLPRDGDITHCIPIIVDEQMSDEQQESSPSDEHADPYESFLSGTFVPSNPPKPTEQEMVKQSIVDRQTPTNTLTWPQVGNMPINEFQSEGYISYWCSRVCSRVCCTKSKRGYNW